jgi:SAM-dependent methyltransferase
MNYQIKPDYWSHKKRFDFIKKYADCYTNPKILDLACGTGILAAFPLAELGYDVTGVDIDPRSIDAAQKVNPFPNLKFVCSDFRDYHPDEKYDLIVAGYIMEHLEKPEELLPAIYQLLAPGGRAIITIPNGYGPHEIEQAIYYRFFEPWDYIYKIRYFNQTLTAIKLYALGQGWHPPTYKPPLAGLEMTVNVECGHQVKITYPWFMQMAHSAGFVVTEMQKGALLHGQITGHIMCNFRPTIWFNTRIADLLPSWMASNWFFALRKARGKESYEWCGRNASGAIINER